MGMMKAALRAILSLVDAIAPLRARARRVRELDAESLRLAVTEHTLLGLRITTLMDYADENASSLVQSLKYDGSGRAATILAAILADYLRDEIASHSLFSRKKVLLVPVPLHSARKRERGFNQIHEVLRRLPQEFKDGRICRLAEGALVRTRATKQQTRLSRSERLSNVAGAFECTDESGIVGTHVFLIDDVTTTGATLANAATPLRHAGAAVTCLALARA